MSLLIKNGTILTAASEFTGDIYIEGEIIRQIGTNLSVNASQTIDASGKYVMPGGVDEHVHYGSFGGRLFETAEAAAAGGTTTIVDFAPQEKDVPLLDAIRRQAAKAEHTSSVDFAFHAVIMDPKESVFEEVRHLPEVGVATLKLFMAYKGTAFYCDDEAILSAMMNAKDAGVTMMVHAENADIITILTRYYLSQGKTAPVYHYYARPPIAEEEATGRAIALAKAADCPLFVVHVSIREAMEAIRDAHNDGWPIFGETCTHYLTFTDEDVIKNGPLFKCAPILQPKEAVEEMWEYVKAGVFSGIASDHSPCSYDEKYNEILGNKIETVFDVWGGCSGIQSGFQTAFSEGVVKRGVCPTVLANSMSVQPAKAFGIYGKKGDIKPGFDADLLIVDPDKEWEITADSLRYVNKISAFVGLKGKGIPVYTIVRGQVVAEDGEIVGQKGFGNLVKKIKK